MTFLFEYIIIKFLHFKKRANSFPSMKSGKKYVEITFRILILF